MSHIKKIIQIDQVNKKERKTYVETMIFFMMFLLTLFVVIVAAMGFAFPSMMSVDIFNSVLSNLLMIFVIAELMIIILIIHRIEQK